MNPEIPLLYSSSVTYHQSWVGRSACYVKVQSGPSWQPGDGH